MPTETRDPWPDGFDLHELLDSAGFSKREGEDVSADLQAFEQEILAGLAGGSGTFQGTLPGKLLSELGAEIFDTLLSNYLKWYRCTLVAASQSAGWDYLAFAGYARIERPHSLGLGVTYRMRNAVSGNEGPAAQTRRIEPVPGSVRVVVDASMAVRTVVAAMKIEKTVAHMLADPGDIVRKTLACRLDAAYGYRQPIGEVGLSIDDGIISVTIVRAP